MDDAIGREWKWANLPSDLAGEIERWFQMRPIYDELLPAFEAEGAKLATRIQAVIGIPVRYVASTFSWP
jgi:hypothetical protein